LLISISDKIVRIWDDSEIGVLLYTFKGYLNRVFYIAFVLSNKLLTLVSLDTTTRLWSIKTRVLVYTLKGHLSLVFDIAFLSNN
ncbi:hypothetical protein F5882DRAFT_305769, partial [Hyaloscypha sp. PMI_1271]